MKKILVPSLILLASCGNNSSTPTESTVYEEPTMTQEVAPTENVEEIVEIDEPDEEEVEEALEAEIAPQKVSLNITRPFDTAKLDDSSEFKKFLANQNMYTVEVSLERPADGYEYATCMRTGYFPLKTYEIRFEEGESKKSLKIDFSDSTSVSGRESFFCEWGIIEGETEHIQTTLLRDKIFEGDVDASEFKQFNDFGVLYLTEGTTVDLQDLEIQIKAEALIAKHVAFESFNGENRVAAPSEDGRDGGIITIDTHYAYGLIEFTLNGQNAFQFEIKDYARAASGRNGSDGCIVKPNIPRGFIPKSMPKSTVKNHRCACLAGSGENGRDGAIAGRNGFNGGNTGRYEIHINSKTNLLINNSSRIGMGSLGEKGQKGGIGGKRGSSPHSNSMYSGLAMEPYVPNFHRANVKQNSRDPFCANYVAKDGNDGKDAPDGKDGENGIVLESKITSLND